MALLLKNWRIVAALTIAAGLVLGAFIAAGALARPPSATAAGETELIKAIAETDSDGDGLPDWEEHLYGTDPHLVDSRGLGMTDGEAVGKGLIVPEAIADIPAAGEQGGVETDIGVATPSSGSLTAVFARKFLSLYLQVKEEKGVLNEADRAAIAEHAFTELLNSVEPVPDFKTSADLKVGGGGKEALRAFAAAAEDVFRAHPNNAPKSEFQYLQDVVQQGDSSAIPHIVEATKVYHKVAAGLAVLTVPTELSADYLALINALERLGKLSNDFARIETDPLATMLALYQYPDAMLKLANAFIHVHEIYQAAGVGLVKGDPGWFFVNIIPNVAAKQEAERAAAE